MLTDARVDLERTIQMTSRRFNAARASGHLRELVARAKADLARQDYHGEQTIQRTIDLRYLGQNYELEVAFDFDDFTPANLASLWADFHALHERRFGFQIAQEVIEAITLRCTVRCATGKPDFLPLPPRTAALAPHATRRVVFADGAFDTPVYARDDLRAGDSIAGPALIEEAASVTVLVPGQQLEVSTQGHLLLGAA